MTYKFYVIFNGISVILGPWEGDNDSMSATEPHLHQKRFSPPVSIKPGTARSAGQHLVHCVTGAPPRELDVNSGIIFLTE